MKVRAAIMLKTGVLDPQGEAIRHALGTLGFVGVEGVRRYGHPEPLRYLITHR